MIKKVTIENIKGISNQTFELNIIPNKPSILVAPNGFGKSSFATAFRSLNSRRIKLLDDDFHNNDESLEPKLKIEYQKEDGATVNLEATKNSNNIVSELDYFVINNQLKARGIGSQFGRATAVLEINNIVLIESIPPTVNFAYQFTVSKQKFGNNSKILPNANSMFQNKKLIEKLSNNYIALERAFGTTFQERINNIINLINNYSSTASSEEIFSWIENNHLPTLDQIPHLNAIATIIDEFDLGLGANSKTKSYLLAIQIIDLFNSNKEDFKKACNYSNYLLSKSRFDTTLSHLNCTWRGIKTSKNNGKLIVKFPKAIDISNGQRDILTFVSMLFKAQIELKKSANILIIDEVFDYLDDANLIAAQYYITLFIQKFKDAGKRIYPIILTHLNPSYFKNYAFSDQKIYYLNKSSVSINNSLIKLLRNRDHVSIKYDVSKYLLHYHPDTISKRSEFRNLGIRELWGEDKNFKDFLNQEIENYLNDRIFCPFAVCGALRLKIEEIAYNKIMSPQSKEDFLNTWKTREKLDFISSIGIISPETNYLLGIIYNDGMHWKENLDNVTPIVTKLENLAIKNMVREVFQ